MALDTYRSAKEAGIGGLRTVCPGSLGCGAEEPPAPVTLYRRTALFGAAHSDIPICILPAGEVILYE